MCGIIGYIGEQQATPLILDGLRRLEYRGYDSAGIATLDQNGFHVLKREGRLDVLAEALTDHPLLGRIGIGHTRWATHGEPSEQNAHPHLGQNSKIAIVHNGIIENHAALRAKLEERGIHFSSQTDSEVIAQLAEYLYQGDLIEMIRRLSAMLEGAYALGILSVDHPDQLVAVRKDSPLIVGLAEGGNFIASDVSAVLTHTRVVYDLRDGEIAVLAKDGVQFYDEDAEPIEKIPRTIDWDAQNAEKDDHPHFMFKEILEQPRAIQDTLNAALPGGKNADVLGSIDFMRYRRIVIVGCGSAYNAGMVGRYVFEQLLRIPVEVDPASEFRYRNPLVDPLTLVILISQSGETADTIAALREAKRKGAPTLAIVNVLGSTIAHEADQVLCTVAGPEIAVATTKAFSAQLILLYQIALQGVRNPEPLTKALNELPKKVQQIIDQKHFMQHFAAECYNAKSIFFIGRGIDFATALEGSLKLKEISYVHSEAYAGGELKHGPISLIEDNTLVVALTSSVQLLPKTMSNVEQIISRGARVLIVRTIENAQKDPRLSEMILPPTEELFSPTLTVVALQLLSYYVAMCKGLDIDKPRNLAKSVTVE